MPKYRVIPFRGKFAVEWYESGKRFRRSLKTDDRRDIEPALRRVIAEVEAERRPEVITIAYAWEGYVKSLGDKPAATTAGFEWRSVGKHFGHILADAIAEETCEAYTQARRAQGRSDSTIWTELGRLRSALRWAERKGLIAKAPFIPRPAQAPPRDKRLTREEARSFLNACELPHVKLFVTLALTTGARMGAILDLTWRQIDFEGSRIDLEGPGRPKTNKGRAVLPMNQMAAHALFNAHIGATTPFVIEWGGQKVKSIKKAIRSVGQRCGLPWVTAHVFRHSAACWMAEDDVSMSEIAQFLGHKNSRITEEVYARFSPSYLERAARSLDLLGSAPCFNDTTPANTNGTKMIRMKDCAEASIKKIR